MCHLTCSWMALYKPLVSFPLQYLISFREPEARSWREGKYLITFRDPEGRGRLRELVVCTDVMWGQVDRM